MSRSETWHTKTCLSMTEGVVIYTHLHLSPPQIAIPSVTIPSTYIRSLLHRFSFHSKQSPLSEGAFITLAKSLDLQMAPKKTYCQNPLDIFGI